MTPTQYRSAAALMANIDALHARLAAWTAAATPKDLAALICDNSAVPDAVFKRMREMGLQHIMGEITVNEAELGKL